MLNLSKTYSNDYDDDDDDYNDDFCYYHQSNYEPIRNYGVCRVETKKGSEHCAMIWICLTKYRRNRNCENNISMMVRHWTHVLDSIALYGSNEN